MKLFFRHMCFFHNNSNSKSIVKELGRIKPSDDVVFVVVYKSDSPYRAVENDM
jgi:hypothetical protein